MKDYSQNGEGKIIADAVAAIEARKDLWGYQVPRVAVEFGAGDGFKLSNIRGLMEDGWIGFQFEKDKSTNQDVIQSDITASNINDVLIGTNRLIGVLSIDVDGNDWWIWKALDLVHPAIVCIEFNPQLEGHKTIRYDSGHNWDGRTSYCGASFLAILKLGAQKGYKAIAKTACNLIFVRAELWPDPVPLLKHEPVQIWEESDKEFEQV